MPNFHKNPHFLKSLTSKRGDFGGFLFDLSEARLTPCKIKLGKKRRNMPL
jgi:hypothetical protein